MSWYTQGVTVFQERMGTVKIKLEESSITEDCMLGIYPVYNGGLLFCGYHDFIYM